MLLLAALKFLFGSLRFNVALEIKPGVPAYAINKMDRMIIWSAALILGPSSLWIGVLGRFSILSAPCGCSTRPKNG